MKFHQKETIGIDFNYSSMLIFIEFASTPMLLVNLYDWTPKTKVQQFIHYNKLFNFLCNLNNHIISIHNILHILMGSMAPSLV